MNDDKLDTILEHLYGELEPEEEESFLNEASSSKALSNRLNETRRLLTAYRLAPVMEFAEDSARKTLTELHKKREEEQINQQKTGESKLSPNVPTTEDTVTDNPLIPNTPVRQEQPVEPVLVSDHSTAKTPKKPRKLGIPAIAAIIIIGIGLGVMVFNSTEVSSTPSEKPAGKTDLTLTLNDRQNSNSDLMPTLETKEDSNNSQTKSMPKFLPTPADTDKIANILSEIEEISSPTDTIKTEIEEQQEEVTLELELTEKEKIPEDIFAGANSEPEFAPIEKEFAEMLPELAEMTETGKKTDIPDNSDRNSDIIEKYLDEITDTDSDKPSAPQTTAEEQTLPRPKSEEISTSPALEIKKQKETARLAEIEKQKEATRLAEIEKQKEAARLAEIKKQKEAARLAEIEKQKEAERLAEIEKQKEATRLAEIEKQKEAARLAEIEKQKEATRLAEIEKQKEAARLAEIKKQKEAARLAEIEKQKEAERLAEIEKQKEAARLAEIEKQKEATRLAEIEKQKEAARLAEIEKQKEAARLAEIEKQKEAARLAEIEKQKEAEIEKQKEAARLAEIEKQKEAARLAEIEKQKEAARLAEIKKQKEAARLAEIEKQKEATRLAEIEKQKEAARLAEIEKQKEAARLAEIEKQKEAARLAEIEKQKEAARLAEIEKQKEAARLAEIEKQKEATRLAEIEKQKEAARLAEIKKQKEAKDIKTIEPIILQEKDGINSIDIEPLMALNESDSSPIAPRIKPATGDAEKIKFESSDSAPELVQKAEALYLHKSFLQALFGVEEALLRAETVKEKIPALILKARIELQLKTFSDMQKTITRLRSLSPLEASALQVLLNAGMNHTHIENKRETRAARVTPDTPPVAAKSYYLREEPVTHPQNTKQKKKQSKRFNPTTDTYYKRK